MSTHYFYGNNPSKIDKYKTFWNLDNTDCPLIGFTLRGYLPLEEYTVTKLWRSGIMLQPEMINPEDFIDDEEKILREEELIDDDIIRGCSPMASAIDWLSVVLGSECLVSSGTTLAKELNYPWDELKDFYLEKENPWYKKYIEFLKVLVNKAKGHFPVSHGAFGGPSDLLRILRGANQSIFDLIDEPKKASKLLDKIGDIIIEMTEDSWKHLPLFHGGYFDAMYQLWAPGPIARIQEDFSSLYSPELYRKYIKPVDRYIAKQFSHSYIHLHSTSMFLLEDILDIQELKCFQINNDVGGPPIQQMIPYFRMVQEKERSLLIRGSFKKEDIKLLKKSLNPRGLYLFIIVKNYEEINHLKSLLLSKWH